MATFITYDVSIELVKELGPIIQRVARNDRDLARQIRRSASSVVLSLAEGAHSDPGNRRARYFNAAGSAKETQGALEVANAWGYIKDRRVLNLADRVVALTYKLANT